MPVFPLIFSWALQVCFPIAATILPLTFEAVQHYTLEDKQLWLDYVCPGRREYANARGTPSLAELPEAALMRRRL